MAPPALGEPAAAHVAAMLDRELDRPWEALLVRRDTSRWTVAARRTRAELVRLPALDAGSVAVAVGPDGVPSATLDGEPVGGLVAPAVDAALRELERRGRLRFQAFVARADNLDGDRWRVSIDPL